MMKLWKKFKDWEYDIEFDIEFNISVEHIIAATLLILFIVWMLTK